MNVIRRPEMQHYGIISAIELHKPGHLERLFLRVLVVVGIFPMQNESTKRFFEYLSVSLFLLSNAFLLYCYIAYIYNCLPLNEEVIINGANLSTASIGTSSSLIFFSFWFKRKKLYHFLKTLNEVKLSRLDKLIVALFQAVTCLFLFLYLYVLIPGYVEATWKCGGMSWPYHFLSVSLAWNMLVISLPIFSTLTFSYISQKKFGQVNDDLNHYIDNGKDSAGFFFRKSKSIRNIRYRYTYLRQIQDEVQSILHLPILGSHVFLLISLISTMLYLVDSILENEATITLSVGVSAASFGMAVVFIAASLIEMEGKKVSLAKEIILRAEACCYSHTEGARELATLIQMSEIKYEMKPGGLYVFDRTFILKMIGAASTYLLVSIQFYLTEKQTAAQDEYIKLGKRVLSATQQTTICA